MCEVVNDPGVLNAKCVRVFSNRHLICVKWVMTREYLMQVCTCVFKPPLNMCEVGNETQKGYQ